MNLGMRKLLSCVLAMTLLITCAISGIVLPASAETTNLLPNGDLEQGAAGIVAHLPAEGVSVEDGVGIDGSKALKFSKDYSQPVTYLRNLSKVTLEPNSS
ncbi:MAG: hypothetical protein J6K62_07725, partial [Clostridia bacterium]|nr:hypothetical protein [Clostridia bacterium]